jgi:hypothetical protein
LSEIKQETSVLTYRWTSFKKTALKRLQYNLLFLAIFHNKLVKAKLCSLHRLGDMIHYYIIHTLSVLFFWLLCCLTFSYCHCQQKQADQLNKNNLYHIPLPILTATCSQFLCILTRIFSSDFTTELLYPFLRFPQYPTYFCHTFTYYTSVFKLCSQSSTSGVSF